MIPLTVRRCHAWLFAATMLLAPGHAAVAAPSGEDDPSLVRARELHRRVPLIDGHNDLPWQVRKRGDLWFERTNLREDQKHFHTDIPRLRAGGVGAQFWVAYPQFRVEPKTALIHTLEAIDSIRTMVRKYPDVFELALTADDAERIFREGRIASFICVEGGQAINHSLGVVRMFHELGARYMTLTHNRTHDWADSATDEPRHGGLSEFGKSVVREMNRLGMMVDLSHTSPEVMRDALDVSRSPVVFTHSNAYALTQHPRNVPDHILDRIPANGGLVMATFVPTFASQAIVDWSARRAAQLKRIEEGSIEGGIEGWETAHPMPRATIADVADHIDYFVRRMGVDHVGIGSDFDGITAVVEGLEDVSKFPHLTAELIRRGYSDGDLEKILGGNLLRVLRANEKIAANWTEG